MKITKEQISKGLDDAYKKAGHNAYFGNGFNAGVEFAVGKFKETIITELEDFEKLDDAILFFKEQLKNKEI